MKTLIGILLYASCMIAFTQCREGIGGTGVGNPGSVKVTIQVETSPYLKDGDDDENPLPGSDITGTVLTTNGDPVMASVDLVKTTGGYELMNSTMTDQDGTFAFYQVPSGTYNIVVKADGDVLKTVPVSID